MDLRTGDGVFSKPNRLKRPKAPRYNEIVSTLPFGMVVVVSNRIPVAKGEEEELERRWKNMKWTIANHPGFIRTEILKPVKADHYVVVTHWEAMKDFED